MAMAQPFSNQVQMMKPSLSASVILSWATQLRDSKIFEDVEALLLIRPDFSNSLLEFLSHLDRTDVTAPLLRQTRIHFALRGIASRGSGWNDQIRRQAEATLIGWQTLFGDLDAIAPDPWAEGNQLAGIFRLKTKIQHTNTLRGTLKDTWIVKRAPGSGTALSWGNNGFRVGRWWINPAAAYRDGIIRSFDGITAGESGATAIVVCFDQEVWPVSEKKLRYRPSPKDPASVRLLRNLTDRNPIRVLRSRKLRSPFAPQVGLRYDGLYYVKGYSLDFNPEDATREHLQYTFNMERDRLQADLDEALVHPTANERDLWEQYALNRHLHDMEPSAVNPKEPGLAILWGAAMSDLVNERRDSGYMTS